MIQQAWGVDVGLVVAETTAQVSVHWHAPAPGAHGEANQRLWIARSTDDCATFAGEWPAWDRPRLLPLL
jgi:hypothetical protein